MSKRKHSVLTFKEIWLADPICQLWIAKLPGDPSLAWCKLCKSNINISKMERSALNDDAKGKRHLDIMEEWQKYTNANFFKSPSSTEPTTLTTWTLNFKSNSFNAEILWCLNMVNQHLSYNSYSHISELFSAMFPDSKVAAQNFQWGKPKVDIWLSMAWPPTSKKNFWKKSTHSYFILYHLMKVLILSSSLGFIPETLKYWVGVQRGQSYLVGRRCLFSLGWPPF